MQIDLSAMPNIQVVQAEYSFLRNVIFSKLHRHFQENPPSHPRVKDLMLSGWQGIGARADFAWLAFHDLKSGPQNSETRLLRCLKIESNESPQFLNAIGDQDWLRTIVDRQNERIHADLGARAAIQIGVADPSGAATRYTEALSWLDREWPEAATCARLLISHVAWVTSDEFWSSSNQTALGLVFINPRAEWRLAHFVETLVHESAHIELRIRQLIDPMLKNPSDLAASPLRPDLRPMNGVLHACFVLVRTCQALLRLASSAPLSQDRVVAQSLHDEFLPKLHEGLEVLSKHANWTPAGERLFADMRVPATFPGCPALNHAALS